MALNVFFIDTKWKYRRKTSLVAGSLANQREKRLKSKINFFNANYSLKYSKFNKNKIMKNRINICRMSHWIHLLLCPNKLRGRILKLQARQLSKLWGYTTIHNQDQNLAPRRPLLTHLLRYLKHLISWDRRIRYQDHLQLLI